MSWEKEREIELFTMFRRLRKCRRCGHFPCPCCVVWCDVIYIDDKIDDEDRAECPCYVDDCECWWTYDDVECNKEVLSIFFKLTAAIQRDLKEQYGEANVWFGNGTTEDGRLTFHATVLKERKSK